MPIGRVQRRPVSVQVYMVRQAYGRHVRTLRLPVKCTPSHSIARAIFILRIILSCMMNLTESIEMDIAAAWPAHDRRQAKWIVVTSWNSLKSLSSLHEDLALVEARVRRAAQVEYPGAGRHSPGDRRRRRQAPASTAPALSAARTTIRSTLVSAAAGVEMLHTASLVHDDTIDKSQLRRGQPTLNSMFDCGTVILIGDYLFAQSAILAAETMNPRVVAIFASTLADICDGQLQEVFTAHRLDQTREDYNRRIYGKTASLFAGAAEMGAVIGGATEEAIQNLRAFGSDVGMAFQIVDDVLDLRSSPRHDRQARQSRPAPGNGDAAHDALSRAGQRQFGRAGAPARRRRCRCQRRRIRAASPHRLRNLARSMSRSTRLGRTCQLPSTGSTRFLDPWVADELAAFANLALERTS